jgi:acetolactate synthase-1/2/3 large subunit
MKSYIDNNTGDRMKVSDYVINTLVAEGITHVFEVCGGALGHLLDSLYGRNDIRTVSMHHEMAAAIAAEGYARASENIGVAMATSGPGATNLITGIGSCYFDSIPCLFITGQVNTYEYKFGRQVRQIGFQETDIVSIVKPIVKDAVLISDPQDTRRIMEESIITAKTGRPGPVLIDFPLNIQRSLIDPSACSIAELPSPDTMIPDGNLFDQVKSRIECASRPLILAGGGVRSSKATKELFDFAHATGIPVVVSLMGLDSFPHDDQLYIGMIGTYGNRYANLTIANADLIIALGTRFDTRQTGTKPKTFARAAKIIHVDIDNRELNNKINVDLPLHMDIKTFLASITDSCRFVRKNYSPWLEWVNHHKRDYAEDRGADQNTISPYHFLRQVSAALPKDAIICVDVGQNQMWAAQVIEVKKDQRFLTQGGMASIGSALPMAIGASCAKPGTPVIVIIGDGGFQLNIQELQTVYHHNLPVKIILLNNSGYGMIRQFQEQYFGGRVQSSVIGYSNPDFQKVVSAYNISSRRIQLAEEVLPALISLFSDAKPGFLEVVIDEKFIVTPKLAVNKPVEDQEPELSREELQSAMLIDILPEENDHE